MEARSAATPEPGVRTSCLLLCGACRTVRWPRWRQPSVRGATSRLEASPHAPRARGCVSGATRRRMHGKFAPPAYFPVFAGVWASTRAQCEENGHLCLPAGALCESPYLIGWSLVLIQILTALSWALCCRRNVRSPLERRPLPLQQGQPGEQRCRCAVPPVYPPCRGWERSDHCT